MMGNRFTVIIDDEIFEMDLFMNLFKIKDAILKVNFDIRNRRLSDIL